MTNDKEQEDTSKSKHTPEHQVPASAGEELEETFFAPLSAEYLLERGYCCGNGCKNCPYDYKAVPEPRRSRLLEERKKNGSNNNHHAS